MRTGGGRGKRTSSSTCGSRGSFRQLTYNVESMPTLRRHQLSRAVCSDIRGDRLLWYGSSGGGRGKQRSEALHKICLRIVRRRAPFTSTPLRILLSVSDTCSAQNSYFSWFRVHNTHTVIAPFTTVNSSFSRHQPMPSTESTPLLPATQSTAAHTFATQPSSCGSDDSPSSELSNTVDELSGRSLPSRWKKSVLRGLAIMGTTAAMTLLSSPHSPHDRLYDLDRALSQNASVICIETPGDTAADRVTSDAEWLRPVSRSTYPDPDYTLCTVIPSSQDDRRLNSTLLLRPENGESIEVSSH